MMDWASAEVGILEFEFPLSEKTRNQISDLVRRAKAAGFREAAQMAYNFRDPHEDEKVIAHKLGFSLARDGLGDLLKSHANNVHDPMRLDTGTS